MPSPSRNEFPTLPLQSLLAGLGIDGELEWQLLAGGRNNRAYRVSTPTRDLMAKHSSGARADGLDRGAVEFEFCQLCWNHAVTFVPEPLACDHQSRLALFEFIPGRTPESAGLPDVAAALEFFRQLNALRKSPEALKLPPASEACFSLQQHLDCVERRLQRLLSTEPVTDHHTEMGAFVSDAVMPVWEDVRRKVALEKDFAAILPESGRVLSPSDFGFHNAIRSAVGDLRFVDFEHAGWDDPAKLVSDFYCQVEVPVPEETRPQFVQSVSEMLDPDERAAFVRRARLLLPVYQVKWCTILLNEFSIAGSVRRNFSAGQAAAETLGLQLRKAEQMLQRVETD